MNDLAEFVHDHRPHGPLTAGATEPEWNGYLLTVECLCGETAKPAEVPLLPPQRCRSLEGLEESARHPIIFAELACVRGAIRPSADG